MNQLTRPAIAALGLLAVLLPATVGLLDRAKAQVSTLPVRAVIGVVAFDGRFRPEDNLPQPDPAYCPSAGGLSSGPPKSILGLLTIGGVPAPAGTVVQSVLDGKLGPAAFVREAGGYRLDYDIAGPACSNHTGVTIGVLVNGQIATAPRLIGDPLTDSFLRFDVAVN